jgi:hypothetical protein
MRFVIQFPMEADRPEESFADRAGIAKAAPW